MNTGKAHSNRPDVLVIGAGIGGLTIAALLCNAGHSVTILEAQSRPGGCAASFYHSGYRFEAGATVGCGFHHGGPLDILSKRLGLTWPVEPAAVSWEYRDKVHRIPLTRDRSALHAAFPRSVSFLQEQERLADVIWRMSHNVLPWPTRGLGDLLTCAKIFASSIPDSLLLPHFFRATVHTRLKAHGLHDDRDFVRFLDSELLITAQTTSCKANAIYGAVALDLPRKGTYHVKGGVGMISDTLCEAVKSRRGLISFRNRVRKIHHDGKRATHIETENGQRFKARAVIANLTHESLDEVLEGPRIPALSRSRHLSPNEPGHGAFILHLGVKDRVFRETQCLHFHLLGDGHELTEGGRIFLSLSHPEDRDAAPPETRSVTISTHTDPLTWRRAIESGRTHYKFLKTALTEKIIDLASLHFPGLREGILYQTAGTPLTYERYTGRRLGYVGGRPQTSLFQSPGPETSIENLYIVGDSIFPGQSIAGVVTGAMRLARILIE